jgi:hypothetical protein
MIDMTDEERNFEKSCDIFKDYKTIDEYIDDIRQLLMIGIIYNRYSKKEADEVISKNINFIKENFANKKDACFCAVNIAYCCG